MIRSALAAPLLAAAALLMATPDARAGDIAIEDPWARASIGRAATGAVYMILRNSAERPDRLVALATPRAERAELHATTLRDDVARMHRIDALDIPPGGEAALAPGGLHVMLVRLDRPLNEGERFPLTLTFERAGEVTIEVEVRGMERRRPPPHGHGH